MNHVLLTNDEASTQSLPLDDPRAIHILCVLKLSPGEDFRAGILHQSRGKAKLLQCGNELLHFHYMPEMGADTLLPITILMGSTRPSVMQRLLRDMTAFGVEKIIIFHTDNSEKSYLHSHLWKNHHYEKYVHEGLCLAKSVTPPMVHVCFNLQQTLQQVSTETRLLADDQAQSSLGSLKMQAPLTLAVGPERGFTQEEIGKFQQAGFVCGHLGQRIMRAETACFVALSVTAESAGLF